MVRLRPHKKGYIMNKLTEQKIKDSADIVDVMSDFIVLKRVGARYTCLCPFHDDHNLGSFSIYPRMNCYKCFSCDAKGGPVDFLMAYKDLTYPEALKYLAAKYNIYIGEDFDKTKYKSMKPAKPRELVENPDDLPIRLWPTEYIDYYTNVSEDNFVKWMRSHKWDSCQRARLEEVIRDYHIGHQYMNLFGEHHEYTIWWELDEKNRLHNAHFMEYKPDGHRDKERKNTQTWLHAVMKRARDPFDDKKERPSYCLFGQHLLDEWPNATVNIVESEKTAIIMATAYGTNAANVWMACSGMWNLTYERLAPIIDRNRRIQLFPDRDGIDKWKEKAEKIDYTNFHIDTELVTKCWIPQDGEKADCGDVMIRMINT